MDRWIVKQGLHLTTEQLKELLEFSGRAQDTVYLRLLRKLGAPWPDAINYSHIRRAWRSDNGTQIYSWSIASIRYARRKGCRSPLVFDTTEVRLHKPSFYDADAQQTVDVDSDGDTVYTDSEAEHDKDSSDSDSSEDDIQTDD